jgi:hypothetical protein
VTQPVTYASAPAAMTASVAGLHGNSGEGCTVAAATTACSAVIIELGGLRAGEWAGTLDQVAPLKGRPIHGGVAWSTRWHVWRC